MKKLKKKKLFHVFLALILLCIMIGRCSLSASAYATNFISDYYNYWTELQKSIFTKTKYLCQFEFDFVNGIFLNNDTGTFYDTMGSTSISYPEINRSVESSLIGLYPDADLISNPYYIIYGKSKIVWANLDSTDSGRYDVCYFLCSIVSNSAPAGGSYSRYTVPDSPFKSVDGNFYIGYMYLCRYQFDKNDNYLGFDSAYIKPSKMPYLLYNTSVSRPLEVDIFLPSNSSVVAYDNSGNSLTYQPYHISNAFRFKSSETNSIETILYNSTYPDILSFSIISREFYLSSFMTNNVDAIQLFERDLNMSNPSSYPFYTSIGIPAGTVINGDNINDYSNHGFYIDNNNVYYNTTNNYNYGLPDLQIQYDNLFKNQPAPGMNFDSDIRYNYIDLLSVPVSSGGSLPSSWLDTYSPIQTNPNIEINSVPVPTETIPPDLSGKMVAISQKGFDLFNCFGLAAPLIAITVFGIVYKRFID